MPPLPTGFPQITSKMVDTSGQITQPWLWLLRILWQRTGSTPGTGSFVTGDMKISASPDAQPGWLLCNGQAVSRTAYANLFASIGTTWGPGDGLTTFNVPNLLDRAMIGAGGGHALGALGGSATTVITQAELPVATFSAIAAETDQGDPHALMQGASGTPIPTQSPFGAVLIWIRA